MEIPKSVHLMNERLGDSLGRNPHGEPLYKWVYSEDFLHWMMKLVIESGPTGEVVTRPELEAVTQPSGIVLMQPVYIERKACPNMQDVWMIVHWNDAGSEASWRMKYGPQIMWPRMGMYTPVNAWAERGQLPSEDQTDKVITSVRQVRSEKELKRLNDLAQAALDAKDRDDERNRKAIIDDVCSGEFGVMPGSRSGSVSIFTEKGHAAA